MKTIAAFILLILNCGFLMADTNVVVRMGETELKIPQPSGFVPVTDDMTNVKQAAESLVGPQNKGLAWFIPEDAAPQARQGKLPVMERTISLQTSSKLLNSYLSTSDFAELKDDMRREQTEILKKAEQEIPDYIDKANKKIKGELNSDVAMKFGGMVPLPVHFENDRSMAFSMLLNFSFSGPGGKSVSRAGYATTSFVYVRGKLLYAYVYGGENDLDWTRQFSKDWVEAIVAANPSDASDVRHESSSDLHRGFDWGGVGRAGLIGAAVGGVVGLIRWGVKKAKG